MEKIFNSDMFMLCLCIAVGVFALISIVSLVLLIYYGVGYFMGRTIQGWATLVISIWGIGGLELLAIGIIGEYIGKIYMETKGRPRFIVEEYLKK